MDRLQRKCVIASAGLHLLLAMILVLESGFQAPVRKGDRALKPSGQNELPVTQFITLLPDPLLPPQSPSGRPVAEPLSKPELPPQPRTEPKSPGKEPKTPPASTNPSARKPSSSAVSNPSRAARLQQFDEIINEIHQGRSEATTIESGGSSTDGDDSYAQFVREIYTRSWDLSETETKSDAVVTKVIVTIGNTGKVLSSSIIRSSSDSQVDLAVQRTLDRVTIIRPFGDGAKDKQRTYTINFSLRAKRS